MKFKVGDRVKTVAGSHLGTVNHVNDSNYPYIVRWDNGMSSAYMETELIQPETQEPVPGKFYRTRDGEKMFCVGKSINSWVYESVLTELVLRYDLPFQYLSGYTGCMDIVGEWVDEVVLPSVEIKQWAVVMTTAERGNIESLHDTFLKAKEYATCAFKDGKYEIVELTGTLPERKVGK